MVLRKPFKTEAPDWDQHRGVTLADDDTPAAPHPVSQINAATATGRLASIRARLELEASATG